MRLIPTLLLLLFAVSASQAASLSPFAALPARIRDQLSPRLLYSRRTGSQPIVLDAVAWARHLLEKLQLYHLSFDIVRAMQTSTDGLLFEMKSHEQANEILTAWRRILRQNSDYGEAEACPAAATTCVSADFELKQTERDFFVGPSGLSNHFGGPTYRMGGH
ncbi:uncharacterized protein LOC117899166 [Drosophila subobscura]|uniref:uncharacterized protein LOC117899166 n=1 Tax=Drosophila subobscura TaxID=7241 RepID=UPI00155B3E17|nr:uncharacterized protein LOC117899166 [Drosophila subobscura]